MLFNGLYNVTANDELDCDTERMYEALAWEAHSCSVVKILHVLL
jgi:hypothetical protein